nr:von Willebrand factor A domain-containing protein 2-like [Crassostrea gigas]
MNTSEGIGEYTFRRIKGYVDYLVGQMIVEECDIRVSAMKYSSSPMVQFNIGQYQDTNTITSMVDHIGYTKGKANMAGAFRSLRTNMFNGNGDRPRVKNVAYLKTDGSVGVNEDITLQEAELAIESDIQIIPIAIQMRRREEIENIALFQGLKTMEIDDKTLLYSMKDDVLEPIFESVDSCADSPCRNGGQCKNNNGGFLCECRAGFSGDVCQNRCPSTGDIEFVVYACQSKRT